MKNVKDQIWALVVLSLLVALPRWVHAAEVEVESVLVKTVPAASGEAVELIPTGYLPDACHELARNEVDVDPETNKITLRVYARRRTDGVCAPGGFLPQIMRLPRPFEAEISLGNLEPGDYRVFYHAPELVEGVEPFEVR